jgi:hemolysin activation/secretion protein
LLSQAAIATPSIKTVTITDSALESSTPISLTAQVIPAPPIPPPQDLLPPTPPPPLPAPIYPAPELPPAELQTPFPTPEAPLPNTIPGSITVARFEVVGSTVFSVEELAGVTAPFTHRPISFAELLQAQAAVTQLYTSHGYVTSGAVIPPQTLNDGVVRIQVVEGGLEAITVAGTQRLNPNYVRSRLAIASRKPLNSRRLLEALQLLQLNPLIQTVSADLSAGTRPGENLLAVRVVEAPSFHAQTAIDNDRSPSVGSLRRSLQVNEANLLGQGDGLTLSYANTAGSNSLDAQYTLPLNPRNGSLSFSASTSSNRVIEEPFDQIDIAANSRSFDLTFRQPSHQTPAQEFAVGLTASRLESETSLLGEPFSLSPGADAQGHTRITALRFFQEWTDRSSQSVFAVRSQFSLGLDALNSTINAEAPDSRFLAWRGQAQWVRLLAPDTLLLLRSDVQLADRGLVPLEQFSVGGQQSVRGYRQDALLADNGALVSAELRIPILRSPNATSLLQVAPFVDFGTTWASSGQANSDPASLLGVGLGLRWQQSDRLTARLDWGIPLISVSSPKRTWQENGLYFSLIYNPF